jgi:hypothetical protein
MKSTERNASTTGVSSARRSARCKIAVWIAAYRESAATELNEVRVTRAADVIIDVE